MKNILNIMKKNILILDYYHFDISNYTNQSKLWYQQLMRSKTILEDFNSYKVFMEKTSLPKSIFCDYPVEWNPPYNY